MGIPSNIKMYPGYFMVSVMVLPKTLSLPKSKKSSGIPASLDSELSSTVKSFGKRGILSLPLVLKRLIARDVVTERLRAVFQRVMDKELVVVK